MNGSATHKNGVKDDVLYSKLPMLRATIENQNSAVGPTTDVLPL